MIAAGILALAAAALPAAAGPIGKLDRIVLDAINRCDERPEDAAGGIRVCGHGPTSDVAGARASRYRLAEEERRRGFDAARDARAGAARNRLLDAGAAGTGSCSAVGAGGASGCGIGGRRR